jgi:hypothetical protein
MPKIRRKNFPPALLDHLLNRVDMNVEEQGARKRTELCVGHHFRKEVEPDE